MGITEGNIGDFYRILGRTHLIYPLTSQLSTDIVYIVHQEKVKQAKPFQIEPLTLSFKVEVGSK